MKICIICQNLQTLGGLQVVVREIALQLQATEKVNFTFLMPKLQETPCFSMPYSFIEKTLDDLVPLENQNYKRVIRTINRNTGCFDCSIAIPMMEHMLFPKNSQIKLVNYINEEQFDWVIGTAFNYSLLVAMVADKIKSHTAGWMHSTFQGYYEVKGTAYYGLEKLNRKYLWKLDKCFVLNKKDKVAFDRNFGLHSLVLHNPISSIKSNDEKHKKGELLFIGRLNKQVKGLDYLLEIIKYLQNESLDFHLTIVGTGPDENWLKQEVESNDLKEYVTFAGFHENVKPFYIQASVLLSTSRWEGFGMTIVEGMSAGVPCVAFDNDGACEIVRNDVDGVLVPKFEVKAFALAIIQLLSDNNRWKSLSFAAKKRARDFEVSAIAKQMYNYLIEDNNYEFIEKV